MALAGVRDDARTAEPDDVMARKIAGVRAERLAGYHDQRGSLVPFMDFSRPFWDEPIVHGDEFTIRPGRIKIPQVVWHATRNWGATLGRIVNFGTARFDPADPDKARIDPHSPVIPFDRTIPRRLRRRLKRRSVPSTGSVFT